MKEETFFSVGIAILLLSFPPTIVCWLLFSWAAFPLPFLVVYVITCITNIISTMINLWFTKEPPVDLSDPKDPLE